jgi:cytoskeletal protein RodZ
VLCFCVLQPLSGWELAYLKVCCKVQGVRKDLISGSTLQIVKVSDLRSYFPKRTVFTENCWPVPKPHSKSLLRDHLSTDKGTKNVPANNSNSTQNNTGSASKPSSANSLKTSTSSATVIKNKAYVVNAATPVNNNGLTTQNPLSKEREDCSKPEVLAKLRVPAPPLDMSRLVNIPEDLNSRKEGAYVVRLVCFFYSVN